MQYRLVALVAAVLLVLPTVACDGGGKTYAFEMDTSVDPAVAGIAAMVTSTMDLIVTVDPDTMAAYHSAVMGTPWWTTYGTDSAGNLDAAPEQAPEAIVVVLQATTADGATVEDVSLAVASDDDDVDGLLVQEGAATVTLDPLAACLGVVGPCELPLTATVAHPSDVAAMVDVFVSGEPALVDGVEIDTMDAQGLVP